MPTRHLSRWFQVLIVVLALVPLPAVANDLSVDAFVGIFSGSGIAEAEDPVYAPETVRDMDVKIRRAGNGFSVTWTTVVRHANRAAKRKTESLLFEPEGSPGRYRARERSNPFSDAGLAWAGISGQTLDIYILNIGDRGSYQLQRYARTMSPRGMELEFSRMLPDGEKRYVRGLLVKAAD